MTRQDPQMKLRLPETLKAQIEEAAKANNRSMNSEIVDRLQATFASDDLSPRNSKRWSNQDLHELLVGALEALGYEENLKTIAKQQIKKASPKE